MTGTLPGPFTFSHVAIACQPTVAGEIIDTLGVLIDNHLNIPNASFTGDYIHRLPALCLLRALSILQRQNLIFVAVSNVHVQCVMLTLRCRFALHVVLSGRGPTLLFCFSAQSHSSTCHKV